MRAASDMGWRTHLPEASRKSTTAVVDTPCTAVASSAPAWGVVDDAGVVEDEPFVRHGVSRVLIIEASITRASKPHTKKNFLKKFVFVSGKCLSAVASSVPVKELHDQPGCAEMYLRSRTV